MTRPMTVTGPTRTAPRWSPDFMDRDRLVKGGLHLNVAEFLASDSVRVTVGANAAAGATSVTVAALTGPIPSGTVLDFGAAKFARLTSAAAAGATTLAVTALPTALVTNDAATYAGTTFRSVASGTPVGRTFTERDAGQGFGPAAATDDEVYLVAFSIADVTATPTFTAYRPTEQVWENYLPGWATMATALRTKIRSVYHCSIGVD